MQMVDFETPNNGPVVGVERNYNVRATLCSTDMAFRIVVSVLVIEFRSSWHRYKTFPQTPEMQSVPVKLEFTTCSHQ